MKNQNGKTSLSWIITIVIVLLISGVSIAMIFGNEEIISELKEKIQSFNTNNTTVQTQNK